MPETIRLVAFSGLSGFMVVSNLLNNLIAKKKQAIPIKKNKILIEALFTLLYSLKNDLENKIPREQTSAIMGGGILLFI
tara:strand:- start:1958 stop:2194 length:237 start_codon:yes stop_codon:yes gene_type:complete